MPIWLITGCKGQPVDTRVILDTVLTALVHGYGGQAPVNTAPCGRAVLKKAFSFNDF